MLLEHVNIQPQLISVCSENRLNPTVILLLPVYSQAVGRHLCPGEVSVSPHPARRQRPTERSHSLPQKPHLQQSHSHVSVCGLHACARTLGRERLKVCVLMCFSEWHSGALRRRCVWILKHRWEDSWSTAGRGERHQHFHLWWSTPGSLNQYCSVKPFPKSRTCVCVCVFPRAHQLGRDVKQCLRKRRRNARQGQRQGQGSPQRSRGHGRKSSSSWVSCRHPHVKQIFFIWSDFKLKTEPWRPRIHVTPLKTLFCLFYLCVFFCMRLEDK